MPFSFTFPLATSLKSRSHSYRPVPAPDEETLLASPDSKEIRILGSKCNFLIDPSFWLTAFAALSIAVTIRNLLVVQLYSQEPQVSYLEAFIGSPYNGLEKLVRNESSPSWPLSSTHYPDFIGAMEGLYVHHALSNGSIVRLDSEVCTSSVSSNRSTHRFPPVSCSAPSSYSIAFVISASSTVLSNWSFPTRLKTGTGTPYADMGMLGSAPTSLCGV